MKHKEASCGGTYGTYGTPNTFYECRMKNKYARRPLTCFPTRNTYDM